MGIQLDRVTIIGAGIGGLCTAIALRQAGYDVAVYEQAPAFGAVGAGLSLWSNAVRGLEKLGLPESALNGMRIHRSALFDWRGRRLQDTDLQEMGAKLGGASIAVHRADLHRALLATLPPGTVQTGRTFTGFEQQAHSILARFADGSSETGGLLIGADGIHSAVRQQLFPQVRLRYAGYAAWRGVVHDPAVPVEPQTSESWGRGARFGIVPIGGGQIYWFATANRPPGLVLSPPERKSELRRRFRGCIPPSSC
jgi:2-polyprenyl-6-methoxyphenol hydroxylase-like FAD-dependent oxidoreductase